MVAAVDEYVPAQFAIGLDYSPSPAAGIFAIVIPLP